jgi:hypothetical protein
MTANVELHIPFESLVEAVACLDLEKKRQLLEILEDLLFQAEEDLYEQDPQVLANIEASRQAYRNGDYKTIEEYVSSLSSQTA